MGGRKKFASEDADIYENAVDAVSTVTLASVALSQGAKPGRGGYSFYQELAEYQGSPAAEEGPILIDVEETAETPEEQDEEVSEDFPSSQLESGPSEDLPAETEPGVSTGEIEEETAPAEPEQPEIEENLPYGSDLLEEDWLEEMEDMDIDEIMEQVHDEMVSGTIPEAKESIESVDSPDYTGILEAEKRGKDRVNFKKYLERRIDEEN